MTKEQLTLDYLEFKDLCNKKWFAPPPRSRSGLRPGWRGTWLVRPWMTKSGGLFVMVII